VFFRDKISDRRDLSRSTTTYFGTMSTNVYCVWTLTGTVHLVFIVRNNSDVVLTVEGRVVTVAGTHDVMHSHCNEP